MKFFLYDIFLKTGLEDWEGSKVNVITFQTCQVNILFDTFSMRNDRHFCYNIIEDLIKDLIYIPGLYCILSIVE